MTEFPYGRFTKQEELERSAELYVEIIQKQGPYFGLTFLLDIGYGRRELKQISEILLQRGHFNEHRVVD